MRTKQQQRAELHAVVARIEEYVQKGGWLGANWPHYPELAIPRGREYEISLAIPAWVWVESQQNFWEAEYELERERGAEE